MFLGDTTEYRLLRYPNPDSAFNCALSDRKGKCTSGFCHWVHQAFVAVTGMFFFGEGAVLCVVLVIVMLLVLLLFFTHGVCVCVNVCVCVSVCVCVCVCV